MERRAFMNDMVRSELEDAVGVENVSVAVSDRMTYGVDYFWVGRMWADRGQVPPMPDWIVRPGSSEEVSKVLKIANYYKIPVHIWGGGSGSQGGALPMAGGIMMACSMWALLYPQVQAGRINVTALGFIAGVAVQYLLDKAVPHTHVFLRAEEGPQTKLGYSGKVVLSEIIHHIPEGMAVGAVYAGFLIGTGDMTLAVALALTLGIALQNVPEGAFVSAPLHFRGHERGKSFLMGVISGVVEPLLGIATVIVVCALPDILPFVMTFAGGAMTFLVIEETIPSMIAEKHSDKGTLSFAVFFTLMMVLTFATRS